MNDISVIDWQKAALSHLPDIEIVSEGIAFEHRKGYHLSPERQKAIPEAFRDQRGFYHWHDASCIPGFFILAEDQDTKARALAMLLYHYPRRSAAFGLTLHHLRELSESVYVQWVDAIKEVDVLSREDC